MLEIRELRAGDLKALVKMLGKLDRNSLANIELLLKKGGSPRTIGLSLFQTVAADLTDDTYAWLADLIGKTSEELDAMAFTTPIDIVKKLTQRGGFKSFLASVTEQSKSQKNSPDTTTP